MVDKESIERLASLARLTLTEKEKDTLAGEMSDIVDFVSQVQEISGDVDPEHSHKNIMREDGDPHEGGVYTERLMKTAATSKGNVIVVPKIISND